MELTVAIPTFMRPTSLRACLDSILAEVTTHDMEILVIDNDPRGSARPVIDQVMHKRVRYVIEEYPGVAHVRNRAVREAKGRYLAFVDDDETVEPGWIDAIFDEIATGTEASFGRVVPRLEADPDVSLKSTIISIYTRDLCLPQGTNISSKWAYLGTGNSLFNRKLCFETDSPFDLRFGKTGGEDVWLIKQLAERGVKLRWNSAATVVEHVSADRLRFQDLQKRRLRQGQQRVILMRSRGPLSASLQTILWMSVGALQAVGYSAKAMTLRAVGRRSWRAAQVKAAGGVGKLLWYKLWSSSNYGIESVDL